MQKSIEYINLLVDQEFRFEWPEGNSKIDWYYGLAPIEGVFREDGFDYAWRPCNDLNKINGGLVDVIGTGKQIFEIFDRIVAECPANNVVVYGYGLTIVEGRIQPLSIHCEAEDTVMDIQCGFAGY